MANNAKECEERNKQLREVWFFVTVNWKFPWEGGGEYFHYFRALPSTAEIYTQRKYTRLDAHFFPAFRVIK